MPNVKLYHGTTAVFDTIDLSKSKFRSDFGNGFYTTMSIAQATDWAAKQKNRCLNDGKIVDALLYSYLVDISDLRKLNIKRFESANREWLEYVINNRRYNSVGQDYDIVIGKVADAKVGLVLNDFDNRYSHCSYKDIPTAEIDYTIERLKVHVLVDQLCFKTERALEVLCRNEFIRSKLHV